MIAGVDVGNATTEVVLVSDGEIVGAGRVPTRGRKGSAGSLRGAAALVRRLERQLGCAVGEARIAPLRAVDTSVVTVPDTAAQAGRLSVLAAGVPTPGGTGACVGPPLSLADPHPPDGPVVAVVPAGLRYDEAAARLRALLAAGTRIGAVLVAGDEGVLVANRLPGELPVIDQVDVEAGGRMPAAGRRSAPAWAHASPAGRPGGARRTARIARARSRRRGRAEPGARRSRQRRGGPAGGPGRTGDPGRTVGDDRRRPPAAAGRMRAAARLAGWYRASVRLRGHGHRRRGR